MVVKAMICGIWILVTLNACDHGFQGAALPQPTASQPFRQVGKHGLQADAVSGRVEKGVPYRWNTGHCGLGHFVDFDGSFWEVVPDSVTAEEESESVINENEGTLELVDDDTAVFRSDGVEVELRRAGTTSRISVCG